ncbi:hypothetical protein [Thermomonas carbonis]|uniref:Uncharacterized protein n=1 Tax=Thermomonas carbonis TaxID=1463158 RepID=A0A7G9SNI5_9GAMM|nr:hypothetical protein [Thermomonas carbonis]QNN69410.1 hypothetical protein H9L16_12095 [Thermomonas carbonis]GHC12769.1 hypothetical protein GCM10010080_30450 [Thermomonas carbonis]
MKILAAAVLSLLLFGCATVSELNAVAFSRHDAIDASVYELLAAPEKFDGHSVRVIGVVKFSFAFEGKSGVYATPDDYRHNTQGNIEMTGFDPKFNVDQSSLSSINGTYAVVEGIFRARPQIPKPSSDSSSRICMGRCWGGGTIEHVNRVSSWQY